jgi:uncharacterized membrane protein YqaE (UPF0057 family)
MIKILLDFDGTIYIKTIDTLIDKQVSIKELYINTIDETNKSYLQTNINDYFFLKDNTLVDPETTLHDILHSNDDDILHSNDILSMKCYTKQKGGFGFSDIIDSILSMVLKVFDPIVDPIMAIINIFKILIQIIIWFGNFIYWVIMFIGWVFSDLLNPVNFFNDFWNSIIIILYALASSVFNIVMGLLQLSINTVGGWMQGFWGWDQSSLTANDMTSNYFKNISRTSGKKCYLTKSNTVPFSIILGTILCPPIGVFMDLGLTGWVNILVCILLTLLFYIPGLVYALLIIYS